MPSFLSDPPQSLYLLLIVAAVVAAAVAFRVQTRKALIGIAVVAVLLGVLFLIDTLVESPREEASRRVEAMAAAATAISPDTFLEHVSPSFSAGTANRERLKSSPAWGLIRQHNVRVAVWGFSQDDFEQVNDSEVVVGFFAKAQTPSHEAIARYVKGRFVRDPDGQFRLKTMTFYDPINTKSEAGIPGWP